MDRLYTCEEVADLYGVKKPPFGHGSEKEFSVL